jgi:hypothetical protein
MLSEVILIAIADPVAILIVCTPVVLVVRLLPEVVRALQGGCWGAD